MIDGYPFPCKRCGRKDLDFADQWHLKPGSFVPCMEIPKHHVPAKDCIVRINVGKDDSPEERAIMAIYNPWCQDNLIWGLTWGNVDRMRYVATSVIESFDYLLSDNINMTEAIFRLRVLRAKRKQLQEKRYDQTGS